MIDLTMVNQFVIIKMPPRKGEHMHRVTIKLRKFGDMPDRDKWMTEVNFVLEADSDPMSICEAIYEATNTYTGPLWDNIQPLLDPKRTHTAVSVGDLIIVDETAFMCEEFGWKQVIH